MAEAGFQVTGIEIRKDILKNLATGRAHFYEPNLDETLLRVIEDGSLNISSKIPPENGSTVYIITVGTPLSEKGRARFDMVERVAADVAKSLKENDHRKDFLRSKLVKDKEGQISIEPYKNKLKFKAIIVGTYIIIIFNIIKSIFQVI